MTPCKDCKDREFKCHGKCERYKQWKRDHDKEHQYNQQLRVKLKEIESITKGYLV